MSIFFSCWYYSILSFFVPHKKRAHILPETCARLGLNGRTLKVECAHALKVTF